MTWSHAPLFLPYLVVFSTHSQHAAILIFFPWSLRTQVEHHDFSLLHSAAVLAGTGCSKALFPPQHHNSPWLMQTVSVFHLQFSLFQWFRISVQVF